MAVQIIRQPDGLYCVFSSSVDSIIVWNATADELIDHYAHEAAEQARIRIQGIMERLERDQARTVYHQFTLTYAEALATTQATKAASATSSPSP